MDKVEETITATQVFEAVIPEHVRVAYSEQSEAGASLSPSIQVWNSDWAHVIDFAVSHEIRKIRVDKISRKDDDAAFIYAVQMVVDVALDQRALIALRRRFASREIRFIQYEHAHNSGCAVMCTWVFFMPSLKKKIQDVMVELHDAATSWPVLVNVDKQSIESVKESFDYFMESFHLPTIEET